MKNLLKILDLSQTEIMELINLAIVLKNETKNNVIHHHLAGKTLAMIFEKASTRTRVSFEVGMYQLGGAALFLSSSDLQIGRGEPICDTARVLSRYCDGIMIRTFKQETVEEMAKFASVPVINALTDFSHPCQILADLMTIYEKFGCFEGLKMCYIGDGNNMANSLIVGGLKMGMSVSVATPTKYKPSSKVLDFAKEYTNFSLVDNPTLAASGANVVITDVWASMGQEDEAQIRKAEFKEFQINDKLLSHASSDVIVLHCLPAHRGEEITNDVLETHANTIFDEAENRLHAQKAVLVTLMK